MAPEPAPVPEPSPAPIRAAPAAGATCPVHAGVSAVAVCARCGTFVCAQCWNEGGDRQAYCPACVPADLLLADLGTRFAAALVDGFLTSLAIFGISFAVFSPAALYTAPAIAFGLGIFGAELYLCATASQSVGKRLLKIRVVRLDGSRASVLRIVLLRNVIPQALGAAFSVFAIIDAVFIFGDARRCLHDYLADTKVIKVIPD